MNSITQPITNSLRLTAGSHLAHVCRASCRKFLAQLRAAKSSILAEFRGRVEEHDHLLELALNEAEAMAWQSGFPQLLFPALAREKAQTVAQWHERQQFLRGESGSRTAAA
jgi:hypothetical protein